MDSKLSPFGGGKQNAGLLEHLEKRDLRLLAELADNFPGRWFDSTDIRRLRVEGVESDKRMAQVEKMVNEGAIIQLDNCYMVTERTRQALENERSQAACLATTITTIIPVSAPEPASEPTAEDLEAEKERMEKVALVMLRRKTGPRVTYPLPFSNELREVIGCSTSLEFMQFLHRHERTSCQPGGVLTANGFIEGGRDFVVIVWCVSLKQLTAGLETGKENGT